MPSFENWQLIRKDLKNQKIKNFQIMNYFSILSTNRRITRKFYVIKIHNGSKINETSMLNTNKPFKNLPYQN